MELLSQWSLLDPFLRFRPEHWAILITVIGILMLGGRRRPGG